MRREVIPCLLLALTTLSVAASELSDKAQQVTDVGSWVKVDDWGTYETEWEITDGFESWQDSINWSPQRGHIVFRLSSASDSDNYQAIYNEATNAWSLTTPPGSASGHAYDQNTIDPVDGELFYRIGQTSYRGPWTGSNYSWTQLPSGSGDSVNGPQVFVPWRGTQGSLLHFAGSPREINAWDKATGAWTNEAYPLPSGWDHSHSHAEYHPDEEYALIIVGNDNDNAYALDKNADEFVRVTNAPCGFSGPQSGTNGNDLFYSHELRQLVYYCGGGGGLNEKFYYFDRTDGSGGSWTQIPQVVIADSGMEVLKPANLLFVSLPHLGVTAVVNAQAPSSDMNKCGTNNAKGCGIWLTKFGASAPECSDGIDNDGDGAIDTADTGCSNSSDTDETDCGDGQCEGGETNSTCSEDCPGAPVECADGVDNDGDGAVDTADAGCVDPSDTDETNCGDGQCEGGETNSSCSEDCAPGGPNVMDPAAVEWDYPTPYSMGYRIPLNQIGGTYSDADRDSSVAVRYRPVGTGTFADAYPPILVSAEQLRDGDPTPRVTNYSGIIWGLSPETAYEVEFTFFDPDGYNEVRTESGVYTGLASTSTAPFTRALPVANPAAPNYPCPDDGDGDGPEDVCDTTTEIQAAIDASTPGSVINVPPGRYDFVSGDGTGVTQMLFVTGIDGTESNPIILRCQDRLTTIIDGENAKFTIELEGVDYFFIEDCTITGGTEAVVFDNKPDSTGTTIRRNLLRIPHEGNGISLRYYIKKGFNIYDNVLDGPKQFPERHTGHVEGIIFSGQGHLIEHNFMIGISDAIGTSLWKDGPAPFQHRNNLIRGNHIQYAEDDCLESDYSHTAVFLHNKCENWNACLSMQPTFGGPIFWVRNICWSSGENVKALKLQQAGTTYGDPSGALILNNLLPMNIRRFSGGGVWNYQEANNMYIGRQDGNHDRHSNTSNKLCGRHDGGDWNGGNCTTAPELIDYAAVSYDGSFDLPGCGHGNSLADFQANTGCYTNSFLASEPIFANVTTSEYPDIDQDLQSAQEWREIDDPTLHTSSDLIDAGVQLNNVTDGFNGSAPDIGPLERGDSVYPYGIRGWTYDSVICDDGTDNDRDGLTDDADPGCADPDDQSERGPVHACDNGLDDDGDGSYDYPDDPECSGPTDATEDVVDDPTSPPQPPGNVEVQ